jgi:hypothetical protein
LLQECTRRNRRPVDGAGGAAGREHEPRGAQRIDQDPEECQGKEHAPASVRRETYAAFSAVHESGEEAGNHEEHRHPEYMDEEHHEIERQAFLGIGVRPHPRGVLM